MFSIRKCELLSELLCDLNQYWKCTLDSSRSGMLWQIAWSNRISVSVGDDVGLRLADMWYVLNEEFHMCQFEWSSLWLLLSTLTKTYQLKCENPGLAFHLQIQHGCLVCVWDSLFSFLDKEPAMLCCVNKFFYRNGSGIGL